MRIQFAEEKIWLELEELVLGEDGKILIERTHTIPSIKLVEIGMDFIGSYGSRCSDIEERTAPEGADYYLLGEDYLDKNKTPLPENFNFSNPHFTEIKYYKRAE